MILKSHILWWYYVNGSSVFLKINSSLILKCLLAVRGVYMKYVILIIVDEFIWYTVYIV